MDVPITTEALLAKIANLAVRLAHEELRSAALEAMVEQQAARIAELEKPPEK